MSRAFTSQAVNMLVRAYVVYVRPLSISQSVSQSVYQSINQSLTLPEKLVAIKASKTKHMRTVQQGKTLTAAL